MTLERKPDYPPFGSRKERRRDENSSAPVAACAAMLAPGAAARQAKNFRSKPGRPAPGQRVCRARRARRQEGSARQVSEEAIRRLKSMPPEEQAAFQTLAVVEGLEFGNGVIEAEIAGAPAPDAGKAPAASSGSRSACRAT